VQTSVHYPPAHLMSIHRDLNVAPLPITEAVGRRELTLPLHPKLSGGDVEYVVEALEQCL
jgi:dTDP-4-amino-4,6-dideoxygalactose transaminase